MNATSSKSKSAAPYPDMERVTHVIVGFSSTFLLIIDRIFGPGQVLFIEDASVARMRDSVAVCSSHPAVAGIVELPCQDDELASDLHNLISRPPNLKAVIPGVEYAVVAAAELAESWGVAGAGVAAARVLRDKALLRQAASTAGVAQPAWVTVDSPAAIEEFSARYDGRCVVKPVDRQGSLGVIRLLGGGESSRDAWEESVAAREHGGLRAHERESPSRFIVEELMAGAELSVQALVTKGNIVFANVTFKDVLGGRYPVELAHTAPAFIERDVAAEVIEKTQRLLNAICFQTGVVHSEWIIDGDGARLVECAGRIPGDRISLLIDLVYGVHFVDALVRVMEGCEVAEFGPPKVGASIRFVTASPGVINRIEGVDRALEMDGVLDVSFAAPEGGVVRPLRSSTDRLGWVIAVSATAEDARECAALAAAAIDINTTEVSR